MEIAYLPALLMVLPVIIELGDCNTMIEVSFYEVTVFFDRVTEPDLLTLMPYFGEFVTLFEAAEVLFEPS
jgi:hypothetical protein